jgi:O-antigen ligase
MSTVTALQPIRNVPAAVLVAVAALLAVAAIGVSYVTTTGFLLLAGLTLVALAVAALRWPRAVLVLVVLAPVLDAFLLARLLPSEARAFTQFFSEALLAVVGLVLLVDGWRRGRVVPAFRTPATVALVAFVALALLSALLNAVPPVVAGAGLFFTLDAMALFYLARIVGFDRRQGALAIGAIVVAVALMALVGFLQGLLDPNLFGLSVVTGRSGEAVRIGSIVRNPNVLGTMIGMALPFPLLAIVHLQRPRWRWVAAGVALLLLTALLLTYSRGSWLGVVAGTSVVLLLLDRRAFLLGLGLAVVGLGIVTYMPRDLLVSSEPSGAPHKPPKFDAWETTEERVSAVGEGRDLRTMFVLNAIPILRDHPLIGVGPGRYGGAVAEDFGTPIYDEYGTGKLLTAQTTVDNFWLHILVEGGLFGAAAFVAMLLAIGWHLVRVALRSRGLRLILAVGALAAAAMVIVSNGTTMLLEGNTVAFMFWLLLGIGSALPAPAQPEAASV